MPYFANPFSTFNFNFSAVPWGGKWKWCVGGGWGVGGGGIGMQTHSQKRNERQKTGQSQPGMGIVPNRDPDPAAKKGNLLVFYIFLKNFNTVSSAAPH